MNPSTHTLELDPAVTWRLVGTRSAVARRDSPAVAAVAPVGAVREPARDALPAMRERIPMDGRDVLELGCFVATLAAIGVLQFGLFALLA